MSISQRTMQSRHKPGIAGQKATLRRTARIDTVTNSSPQARASKTLTVSGAFVAGTIYTYTIEGRTLAYTSVAGDTNISGVAASIAAQINGDPQIRAIVSAEANAAVITLTGLLPNVAFTTSESDANLAFADVTTAAAAEEIPFGAAMFFAGTSEDTTYPNKIVKLPEAGDLAGDSSTLTPNVLDTTGYFVTIIDGNTGQRWSTSFTSDGDATAQEIVEGLKADIDGEAIAGVTVTEDDATITIALPFGYRIEAFPGNVWSDIQVAEGDSLEEKFAGIAMLSHEHESGYKTGTTFDSYEPNSQIEAGQASLDIYVSNGEQPAFGATPYLGLAGAERGLLYKEPGANRIKFTPGRWQRAYADVAVLRLL